MYQSADGSQTWSHVFSVPDTGWRCRQAVRVAFVDLGPNAYYVGNRNCKPAAAPAADSAGSGVLLSSSDGRRHSSQSGVTFWTLEKCDAGLSSADEPQRLRIYTVYPPSADARVGGSAEDANPSLIWRDVTLPPSHISLKECRLVYDSNVNAIYLSDYQNSVVHLFAVTGEYKKPFVVSRQFKENNRPRSLAVDCERDRIYVGQQNVIGVFRLKRNSTGGKSSRASNT